MKHPSNRDLFAYWTERRGARLAPERGEIEPSEIRQVLGDTFVLASDGIPNHPFRLAGTRLCALFGRELKGESFVKLWDRTDQAALRELIGVVMEEKVGVVASASGFKADDDLLTINLELLLLPLAYRSKNDARVLGSLAPLAAPYWLGARAIGPLRLGMFRHLGSGTALVAPARFVAAARRLKRGLTVYDGGRTD